MEEDHSSQQHTSEDVTGNRASLNRRQLLRAGLWTCAGAMGLALAGIGGRLIVGQSLEPATPQWVKVGAITELSSGEVHQAIYTVSQKDAWRTDEQKGSVYAYTEDGSNFVVLSATCSHLGCNVQWDGEAKQFYCPCHSGFFNRNGDVISGPPPRPLARLETKIEDGTLFAQI